VLSAVSRFTRQVGRFDPPALQELFESRGHVQYFAS
jgi:hypothetical protein